ncbi:oxygenase MpaB family protein [Agromyces aurantiacus]|uniref:Oxygenase MpaB family protein n=1 Tax=Agromyces aurantiacus TaxID=165814 RepID=A0ABV9R9T0_9MICO|nr:oxygenase MpaB family protein [Agromyces aurantiacus]MBM7504812.1 uncharacterized protein (DUF2236 family) [Agromyces aurantiacus]
MVMNLDEHDREILRRYAADATFMAGGAAAILLQLADPRIAAGVARHSGFRERPLDRLAATHQYLMALWFGDERDIRAVVRAVNARHAHVRGDDAPRYDAREPDAQRWVAATILHVGTDLERRMSRRPLDPATADALVRAYAPLAGRLQGASAGWPSTRAEFDAWWSERLSHLEVGPEARAVARDLLAGTGLPAPLRPLMAPVRLVTVALLPPEVRAGYGFGWTPRIQRVAGAWIAVLGAARRIVPMPVRTIPMRISLRRVRQRSRYAEGDLRGRG